MLLFRRLAEVGIYKRKKIKKIKKELDQISIKKKRKQGRKQELVQEIDQEKKKVFFHGRFLVFLIAFLVEFFFSSLFSFFLERFLGRVPFSFFLTFMFSFINSHRWLRMVRMDGWMLCKIPKLDNQYFFFVL